MPNAGLPLSDRVGVVLEPVEGPDLRRPGRFGSGRAFRTAAPVGLSRLAGITLPGNAERVALPLVTTVENGL